MNKGRTLALAAMALTGLLLGGCREEEQGRVLNLDKGVYQGTLDTRLSEESVRALQERARYQTP